MMLKFISCLHKENVFSAAIFIHNCVHEDLILLYTLENVYIVMNWQCQHTYIYIYTSWGTRRCTGKQSQKTL